MNDETKQLDRLADDGNPVVDPTASDERSVYDKSLVKPQAATREQIRSIVDALSADIRRAVKVAIKPKDAELLARVATRAVELRIRAINTQADFASVLTFGSKSKQIESQLAAIKSIASSLSAKRFWTLTNAVIDRMAAFAVTAIAAV